jgi:putative peptidoglycan lipid II flippase
LKKTKSSPNSKSSAVKATFLVVIATALSRVLGYIREVVVAAYYGTGYELDAYRVAVQLPNLFRLIVGDVVLTAAFIPIFSSYLARNEEEEAWSVASKILTITVVVLSLLTLLGMLLARPLISFLAPGFQAKPETYSLSVNLARIMFPALVFMALSGLFSGMLNSYHVFLLPALSPTIWNLIIISGIALFSGKYGIYAFAVSLLIASLVQALVQVPAFWEKLRFYRFDLNYNHPEVKRFYALLVPVILSSATSNINTIVDTRFASYLQTGVVAALGYAIRIYLVPAGVFGVALSTVLFPRLVRYETLREKKAFTKELSFGLQVLNFVMLPVAAFFIFFALPIVRLLFERGNFTFQDSQLTAAALAMYSVGVVAYSLTTLIGRAYYSKNDSRTPLYVSLVAIGINYFGDWYLMRALPQVPKTFPFLKPYAWVFAPHAGIALSTSIVAIFQFFALLFIYLRIHGRIESGKFFVSIFKSMSATAAALATGFATYNLIRAEDFPGLLLGIVLSFLTGMVIYFGSAYLLRMEELKFLVNLLKERFSRKDNE